MKPRPAHPQPAAATGGALALSVRGERRPFLGLLLVVALAITLGTLGLLSPPAHHAALRPIDALLLATSAVCTTGLSSVDISQVLTPLGQLLLAALIEVGALGLLLLAYGAMRLGPRRARDRLEASQQLGLGMGGSGQVSGMLRRLLGLTLGVQALGFACLLPAFVALTGPVQGTRYALMHAVMAFGNAGFGVWPDGVARLPAYALVTLMLLVIAGSSGFVVLHELERLGRYHLRRLVRGQTDQSPRPPRLSTQTRVGLKVSGYLLVLGAAAFAAIEWTRPATLGPMPWPTKLLHATFQTAVTRSAGFSTLDYTQFSPLSLLLIMGLMFVGGNSGSTAGGIKTGTLAVLLSATRATLRAQADTELSGRRVSTLTLMRSLTILTLAGLAVGVGSLLLMVTDGHHRPIVLMFEAVSAFTTSGLSVGLTPSLSGAGKLVLVGLMFLGRIGFLSLLLAFGRGQRPQLRLPEEHDFTVG